MSRYRSRRVDRDTAERLLRGEPVEPRAGLDPLADLLTAAGATDHDGELAGEQAAVSAFRAAHLGPVAEPRRPSVLTTLLANLLTVKLAVAALAAGAVGGVAVAAAAGALPALPGLARTGPPTGSQPPVATSESPPPPAAGNGANSAPAPGQRGPDVAAASVGLCRSYLADAGAYPGRVLDEPAFGALVTAAGGEEKVPGYCGVVLHQATAGGYRNGVPADPSAQVPPVPQFPPRQFGVGPGSAPGAPFPPTPPAPATPPGRPGPAPPQRDGAPSAEPGTPPVSPAPVAPAPVPPTPMPPTPARPTPAPPPPAPVPPAPVPPAPPASYPGR